jgi:Carboxypeptidase regulatory-like domain
MSNVFRRLILSSLIVALIAPSVPVFAAPARAGQPPGSISGLARSASSQPLPNTVVRLRSAETGQISGSTTTGAAGQFSFAALNPGTYVVEVLDAAGQVVGTSAAIVLSPAAMIASGLVIQASALGTAAAAGAVGGASFLGSTLGIVTIAAIAAGVVGAVVVVRNNDDASPAR